MRKSQVSISQRMVSITSFLIPFEFMLFPGVFIATLVLGTWQIYLPKVLLNGLFGVPVGLLSITFLIWMFSLARTIESAK